MKNVSLSPVTLFYARLHSQYHIHEREHHKLSDLYYIYSVELQQLSFNLFLQIIQNAVKMGP